MVSKSPNSISLPNFFSFMEWIANVQLIVFNSSSSLRDDSNPFLGTVLLEPFHFIIMFIFFLHFVQCVLQTGLNIVGILPNIFLGFIRNFRFQFVC